MDSKKLLFDLIYATDENEVQEIIDNNSTLNNCNNWQPYGDNETNFNTVLNQQGKSVQALIEKPINSIDALLLRECKLRGINPKGLDAPKSIQEAVESFFEIKNADFRELLDKERRKLAENIQIIAEGSKKSPNIIIYDAGEGQHPSDFKSTFLSLSKNNKLQIKFVQGQYCMGSTGALPFCGKKKFQLVLSRKHPQLLVNGHSDLYGFTLVRKHTISIEEEKQGYKSSWCEYAVNEDGEIFSFYSQELELGLYNRKMDYGSYVKLYSYNLPHSSDITLDLWRDLNQFLFNPPLPLLVYEKRFSGGHSPSKVMLGNKTRVYNDDRESVKTNFTISFYNKKLGNVEVEVTVFNPDVKNREFIDKKPVVLTRNGQVHGYFDRPYITQEAKLPYLKDHILVHVNCNDIPQNIREEIFMPSRDRYREDSIFTRELKDSLSKELHQNELLKKLNEERMNQLVYENQKDKSFVENVIKKIAQKDDSILKILSLTGNINIGKKSGKPNKIKKEGIEKVELFKGKRFPSIFKIKNGNTLSENYVKTIPLGGEGIIKFETDVENDYLIRSTDRGEFYIKILQFGKGGGLYPPGRIVDFLEVNRVGPYEGTIKLRLKPTEDLNVGDEIKVSAKLTSPEGDKECIFLISIGPKKEKEEKVADTKEEYSLPKLITVFKEPNPDIPEAKTWTDYSWDGEDVVKIFPSSHENSLIDAVAVNVDAYSLYQYLRTNRLTGSRLEAAKRVYEIGIFLTSIFHYYEVKKNQSEWKGLEAEEVVANLMKGYSKVILYLLLNEQLIKELESSD